MIAPEGKLIIVGGAEDKTGEQEILKEIIKHAGKRSLVVVTAASEIPEEVWETYRETFHKLGVKNVVHLPIENQQDARRPEISQLFEDAGAVYFSGGDQLRITTKLGGSTLIDECKKLLARGGTVGGTSAGAAMMGEMMLVGGENTESHKVGNWMMAPGIGFARDIIVDQHFAQRGRIGRLLGAIALNPGVLGIGIDENTSVVLEGSKFRVMGAGAVYVIDGRYVTYTNISEASADQTMSMHNVRIHVLGTGEAFDLFRRLPILKVKEK